MGSAPAVCTCVHGGWCPPWPGASVNDAQNEISVSPERVSECALGGLPMMAVVRCGGGQALNPYFLEQGT